MLSRVELNSVISNTPCPNYSLRLEKYSLLNSNLTIICDVLTGIPRPVVPPLFRLTVFQLLHSLSHPGIRASQQLISNRFVWSHMHRDIKKWTRSCLPCQSAKITHHTVAPLSSFPTPDARFDNIHVDIAGPLSPL